MTEENFKTFSTLDLYIAAFLTLNNLEVKLESKNRKVVFTFPISNELYRLLNQYNSNDDVPVADFVTTIKTLRGQMLSMRNNENKRGNGYGRQQQKH